MKREYKKRKRLITVVTAIYLLFTSMTLHANDTISIPQGFWEVVQITVEKNIDGKIEKNVYDKVDEVKSNIKCPHTWLIVHTPQGILLRYDNGNEKSCYYDFDDNNLIISLDDGTKQSYKYELKGEELILTTVFEQSEKNKEQWIIILKKSQIQY